MPNRLLCLALLGLWSIAVPAQDKTLTFDNATPAKTVHLLNGSNVTISTTGNLVAKCVLDGTLGCADVGTGGGGSNPAPTVTIVPSGFSNSPDVNGKYLPGTTFTITPTVTNAEVCVMSYGSGSPTDARWGGNLNTTFPAQTNLVLSTGLSTYVFYMKCFGAGGSTLSSAVTLSTSNGTTPPPPQCSGINPPAGFTASSNPAFWTNLFGTPTSGPSGFPFTNYSTAGVPHTNFLSFLGTGGGMYAAVKFTVPASGWTSSILAWSENQIQGLPSASVQSTQYYITISRCPGDFRIDIPSPQDETEKASCKNVYFDGASYAAKTQLALRVGPSDFSNCGLQAGQDYYLNYVNADPSPPGGISSGENGCPNGGTCGVQIQLR